MNDDELKEIIDRLRNDGTDTHDVEAKLCKSELPKRMWETLSAFANTPAGGTIILGLDEARGFAAVGVGDVKKVQADLASVCDDMIPPLRPAIHIHAFEGVKIIVAEVAEATREQKPCYFKGAGLSNGAFVRVGDGDRKLSSYEVQLLIASRGQPSDDAEPIESTSIEDLDQRLVKGFIKRVRAANRRAAGEDTVQILRRHRVIATARHGAPVLTVAGLLGLGAQPQLIFPSVRVDFLVFPKGESLSAPRFEDNRRIEGSIPAMLDETLKVLRQQLGSRTIVKGARRRDEPTFPETALREAIANALVHRDLSPGARGTPVQVQLHPDRLIVTNPGGLFGPVTIDRLGEPGILAARNAVLMRLLEDVPGPSDLGPICENRGSGIAAMVRSLQEAGLQPPRFEDHIAQFRVAFPNQALLGPETTRWLADLRTASVTQPQRIALAMLHHGYQLTNATFRAAADLDSRDATRQLGDLVERGLVEQVGTRGGTTYRLAAARRRDRRSEILSWIKEHGSTSRSELQRALSLSPSAAAWWLAIMRREGTIEPTVAGRSPKARYRLRRGSS